MNYCVIYFQPSVSYYLFCDHVSMSQNDGDDDDGGELMVVMMMDFVVSGLAYICMGMGMGL